MKEWTPGTIEYFAAMVPMNQTGEDLQFLAREIITLKERVRILEEGKCTFGCGLPKDHRKACLPKTVAEHAKE